MEWLLHFLSWYIYLFIVGIVFFPISHKLFGKTLDKGYAFSKAIGIILLTYTSLLLGILRLVPFGRTQILVALLVFGFIAYRRFIVQKNIDIPAMIVRNRKVIQWIIVEEVLFFAGLLMWTIVRGQEPSIHGLEKFMDFGFMQSIARSTYFPPLDMWYSADLDTRPAGYFINYYYFGHLSGALLTKLTGVPAGVGYNLILANILGLSLSMTFSIVTNLIRYAQIVVYGAKKLFSTVRLALYGLIGALILNMAGNWHTIYLFTKGYENESPVPPWTVLPDLPALFAMVQQKFPNILAALGEYSHYWYPNATRFIPKTIHEFPSYSYVVADLHGHVFDIPFVLLTLALFMLVFMPLVVEKWSRKRHADTPQGTENTSHKHTAMIQRLFGHGFISTLLVKCIESYVPFTLLLGFLTAVQFMTNAFDGPIFMLLSLLMLFVLHGLSIALVINIIILVFGFIYFSLPFSVFFEPFVSGVGVNCAFPLVQKFAQSGATTFKIGPFLFEQGNCQRSELYQVAILWGFFWFFALILALIMVLTRRYLAKLKHAEATEERKFENLDKFVGLFFLFGTFLIIIPEFFYVKDIYPTHFRANTMFKLGYQAYTMMSLASIYVLWRITTLPNVYATLRRILVVLASLGILMNLLYMNFAVQSYYGNLTKPVNLDGTAWLKDTHPDIYDIVRYFETNVSGQPVILEAQGDSYTDFDVISSYTGLPTVAGWWVHEWLWRGTSDVVGVRIPDIESIYQSENIDLTRRLLRKYKVEYVVIASNERQKYEANEKKISEEKFTQLGTEVYRSTDGKGVVYKIK
ncbi:hypothetical protein KBB12_01670 [Candidatus Woesebacteria bacterium]|nr:hypothetical protein [Candidatus Woesebacteria bacterium]